MSLQRPVITLIGENVLRIKPGTIYEDAGATVTPSSLQNKLITFNNVNTSHGQLGTYEVTYNVTNENGVKAQEVVRTVKVVEEFGEEAEPPIREEPSIPVITLIGENVLRIKAGETYEDAGATAFDKNQGDITDLIVTTSNVDTNQIGKYTVTYNAKNENGVSALEVFRTVVVVDEATPTITVTGDNPATVEIYNRYDDAGATAIDQFQGDITHLIRVNNQVNTNVAGKYQLTYTVTNEGGQTATATRDVHVLGAPPTITLAGSNPMGIDVFQQLELPGAFGSDSYFGDLTNDIVIDNPVNMNKPGTYYIAYSLTNPSGITAKEVIRTVRVFDPYVPTMTVIGSNPYTINISTTGVYRDQGATASDRVYGNLTPDIVVTDNVDLTTPGNYEVTYQVTNEDGLKGESTRTVTVIDTSKADHTMLESAGTHGVTLSDSFKTSGSVYLGLANPSRDPDFDFIDVTSKVIADMGDTSSFTLTNGDVNSWHGIDVAPGIQKSLYFFDK